MCSHCWNRLIAGSAALAAAGVVTCAAAIVDAFMPKGSPGAFFASTTLLGLAVTGVMIGYAWVCDDHESHAPGEVSLPSAGKPSVRCLATNANIMDNLGSIPRVAANH